jgi:hypothetical protein
MIDSIHNALVKQFQKIDSYNQAIICFWMWFKGNRALCFTSITKALLDISCCKRHTTRHRFCTSLGDCYHVSSFCGKHVSSVFYKALPTVFGKALKLFWHGFEMS